MAKIREEIGNEIYLFKEPNGYAPECLISTHGIYRATTPEFPVVGVSLRFYCADGETVDDISNVREFKWQRPRVVETIPREGVAGATEYILSKYQASHAEVVTGLADLVGETYNHLLNITFPGFDIVTVRNRWWMNGVKLSTVLQKIENRHNYGVYHCLFCRELR